MPKNSQTFWFRQIFKKFVLDLSFRKSLEKLLKKKIGKGLLGLPFLNLRLKESKILIIPSLADRRFYFCPIFWKGFPDPLTSRASKNSSDFLKKKNFDTFFLKLEFSEKFFSGRKDFRQIVLNFRQV